MKNVKFLGRLGFLAAAFWWVLELLINNQWLMALVVGAITGILYKLVPYIYGKIVERFTVRLQISDPELIQWLGDWIQTIEYGLKCKNISARVDGSAHVSEGKTPTIALSPGTGDHIFKYKGRWFWLWRTKDETSTKNRLDTKDSITIKTFGKNTNCLLDILDAVVEHHVEITKEKVSVYYNNSWAEWRKLGSYEGRPLSTVVLADNIGKELLKDAEEFFNSSEWYSRIGLPYRRGYLFYGPAGTGKSSLAKALATEVGCNLYVVALSDSNLDDGGLMSLVNSVKPNSILLIEDVDAVFKGREKQAEGKLTFSGLLNAIDGVAAQEGKIVIMTTNFIDRLDDALIRPGRIDVQKYFGLATKEQAKKLWNVVFPGSKLADLFAKKIKPETVSPAQIQNHLVKYKDNPQLAFTEWNL